MRIEVDEISDPSWRLLAKFVYFALNLSMMYLTMNVIVAIICETNQSVRTNELELDWLSLVAKKMKSLQKRVKIKPILKQTKLRSQRHKIYDDDT
jgi:hypothetical protein